MKHLPLILAVTTLLFACSKKSTDNDDPSESSITPAISSSGTSSSGTTSTSSSSKQFAWICEWNGKQARTVTPTVLVDPNNPALWPFSRPVADVVWGLAGVTNEKAVLVDFHAPEVVAVSKTGAFESILLPSGVTGYPSIGDIELASSETHLAWTTNGQIFVLNYATKALQTIFTETDKDAEISDLKLDAQNLYYSRTIDYIVESYYKISLAGGTPSKLFKEPYMSNWFIASNGSIYGAEGGPFSEGGIYNISATTGAITTQYLPDSTVYGFFGMGETLFSVINNIVYQSSITSPASLTPIYNESISNFDQVELDGEHFFLEESHGVSHIHASTKTCETLGEDRFAQFKPSKGTLFAREAVNGRLYTLPY